MKDTNHSGTPFSNRMKQAFLQSRRKATQEKSAEQREPEQYAQEQTSDAMERLSYDAASGMQKAAQRGMEAGRQAFIQKRVKEQTQKAATYAAGHAATVYGSSGAGSAAGSTAAQAAKRTAQTTDRAARAAKDLAITKQRVKQTAKRTKAAAKLARQLLRAILRAAKSLVAVFIAGGSVTVMSVVVICLVGLLLSSSYGIFFSSEDTGNTQRMRDVIQLLNDEYEARIDAEMEKVDYDTVEIIGERAAWPDMLALYAVSLTTAQDGSTEVVTINPDKVEKLRGIFWDMNSISSEVKITTETHTVTTVDEKGRLVVTEVTTTKRHLIIMQEKKAAADMLDIYRFDARQTEQVAGLLSDENAVLWNGVLYGIGIGKTDITEIALSQVGNVGGDPYWSWYGYSEHVDWCACFVSWCAEQCGYLDKGLLPRFSTCTAGVRWFKSHGQWLDGDSIPEPGTIIFFDWVSDETGTQDGQPDHVGIVQRVEDGVIYTVEGNLGNSCRQQQYAVGDARVLGFGCSTLR